MSHADIIRETLIRKDRLKPRTPYEKLGHLDGIGAKMCN